MSKNFFGFEPRMHDEGRIVPLVPPPTRLVNGGGRRRFDSPEHPLDKVEPGVIQVVSAAEAIAAPAPPTPTESAR